MYINDILKSTRNCSVFTIGDITSVIGVKDRQSIYSALNYAEKHGNIIRITKGIYAFDENYSRLEFANKFRRPSYISTYTVLQNSGVIFQPNSSIFVISNRSEIAEVDGQKYVYRKIKNLILLSPLGIEEKSGISIATPERAICDKIYLDGDEYFDNLRNIDWKLMRRLNAEIYQNNSKINLFIKKNQK